MERGDHAEGRPLTVSTGRRLERDPLDADDRAQGLLETPHELERTLHGLLLLVRVEAGEAWKRGRGFVGDGVVLHDAAAERVEVLADRIVKGRHAAVVPHDLWLAETRQPGR